MSVAEIATVGVSAVGIIGGIYGAFRVAIRSELSAFQVTFMQTLNGTYLRSEVATAKLRSIEEKLAGIDEHGCQRLKEHRRSL